METQADLSSFSLFDPDIQKCPFALYGRLRREAPIYWSEETGSFIVSRYETARQVALETGIFSSVGILQPARSAVADEVDAIRATTYPSVPLLVANDPPAHGKYRKISNAILTPKRMAAALPLIEATVAEFLDPMIEKGGGEFIREFAEPIPLFVICRMMGIPDDMTDKCRQWSDALMDPLTSMISAEREIECAHLFVERQTYFTEILERLRRDGGPADQLLTNIAEARTEDGELLSMAEALVFVEQYFVAGAETTADSMGLGTLLLTERPGLMAEIRDDKRKLDTFVEEVLRLYAPSQGQFRRVLRDTELEGVKVPAGSKVMIRWGAANRDEAVFDHGEDLDLDRRNARAHVTFGYGIHTCQGAPLARLELAAAFSALTRRLRGVRVDEAKGGARHLRALLNMGMTELHLTMERAEETRALRS